MLNDYLLLSTGKEGFSLGSLDCETQISTFVHVHVTYGERKVPGPSFILHMHHKNFNPRILCRASYYVVLDRYLASRGILSRVARLRLRNSEGIYRDPFFRYSILDAEHRLPTDEKVIPSCYSDVKSGDIVGSFYYLPW